MSPVVFYHISPARREYLGLRLFRWNPNTHEIITVVVNPGEPKRGHSGFGIYTITQQTFFANYLAMGYAIPCSESTYKKYFSQVLKILK